MSATPEGVGSRLAIAFRTHLFLVLLIGVVVAFVTYQAAPSSGDVEYEAKALVVAKELVIRPEGLPRFATAVFEGGSVAETAVSANAQIPYPANELIPDHVEVRPFENTVVLQVIAVDPDASLAASMANTVARAYVTELNARAGPGVGVFDMLDTARTPTTPESNGGGPVALVLGVVTGAIAALAAIIVWVSLRRPVMNAAEASRLSGLPVLATLKLDRGRRGRTGDLPNGAAALARQLFPTLDGMAALVDTARSGRARSRVAGVVARVLGGTGDVYLVSETGPEGWPELEGTGVQVSPTIPRGRVWATSPVVIDGPSEVDLPLLQPPNARLALVVIREESEPALEEALARFVPGDLAGIVFVTPGRRIRLPRRARPSGASVVRAAVVDAPSLGAASDDGPRTGDVREVTSGTRT